MTAAAWPLLAASDLATPIAWCAGQPRSAGQFIAQAQALAEQLPAGGRPINLCQDRYHFALGLAAALLRGQTSLMPPNTLPTTLCQLQADGGAPPYVLTDVRSDDAALSAAGLARVDVHADAGAGGLRPATAVPLIAADLQAVCLLTSGSTGPPQPHCRRWGALVASIRAEAERLAELMQRDSLAGLNLVATVPAQHSYGFESSVLLALLGGAAFDAGRPFYPADIAQALARLPEPRALVTTPLHLKTLLRAGVALPRTALTLSATAPLSPQLAAQAEAALGGPLIEIYGCTEAGQVASRRTSAGEAWCTLGELQLAREVCADGERFIATGGHVPQPTPLADVLELLDARHFRLLGRANDLIHVAGKRSSLAHLNFHLNRIEGVHDGAFWLPDEVDEGVVRPLVFVVAPQLTARQVIAGLREHLESAFVPRRVLHVAALPREATGKLTAQALRHFALQTLSAAAAAAAAAAGLAAAAPSAGSGADEHRFEAEHTIAPAHPAFAGHFPGRPVLPGVVLLSLVMHSLGQAPALWARLGAQPRIERVKFLAPVGPGARLRVALRGQGAGVAFEVLHGAQAVARGQLSAAAPGVAV